MHLKARRRPNGFSLWAIPWFVLMAFSTIQEPAESTADTNPVVNPCAPLQPIQTGDAVSLAIALGGDPSLWYNQSSISLNVLSPCSPNTAPQVPAGALVTVFRPIVDQLSLLQILNTTLTTISTTFPAAATLIVYAGYNSTYDNGTVVSAPRIFSTPAGIVGGLLLVVNFDMGVLTNLTWKDAGCTACSGNSSSLCMDSNCATAMSSCNAANVSDPSLCMTRINVAFSGVDKNSLSFTSWMNVNSVTRYSLSALYSQADNLLNQGVQSVIGGGNTVGTGGAN